MVKKALPYILFILIALVMIWIRVAVGAQKEADAGTSALAQNDLNGAIHHFDRGIHWYFPGSGSVAKSIDGLMEIAGKYAANEDTESELYTWRILRSALYSVRHVRQPYPDVIATCDEKIATLMAMKKGEPGTESFESEKQKRYAQLTKKVGPKTGYALLAEAGFFGWVIFALLFIWLGVRPDRGFHGKRAFVFGLLFAASYLVWILGLSLA
jgi:hypothetical protein